MSELVAECPRCDSVNMTFDVAAVHRTGRVEYRWRRWYEVFAICRNCNRATIYRLANKVETDHEEVNKIGLINIQGALNRFMDIEGYINLSHMAAQKPPEHLPDAIRNAFNEGAICLTVECWNAAATMFRLCVDLATRPLLPEHVEGKPGPDGLNKHVRRNLGPRLTWLFDNKHLPEALRDLSACIREDGNDGAHAGTLTKEDAEDLLDFTTTLMERLYTEPAKVRLAAERRDRRRGR